jgi:hypothetical protein
MLLVLRESKVVQREWQWEGHGKDPQLSKIAVAHTCNPSYLVG